MIGRVLALVAAASWLAAAAAPATAAIYRWIDEEDVVNYTDDFSRFESHRRRARPDDQVARNHDRPRVREVEDSPDALVAPDGSRSARASTNPDAPARSNRAEAVTPAMDAAADEIIRRAGLDAQIELFAGAVQAEFERWRWRWPAIDAARADVATRFGAELLRRNMLWSLAHRLDPARAAVLLGWLRTPLSRRIVALETASSSGEQRTEQAAFVNRLPGAALPPRRLALLRRAERAAEMTASSAVAIAASTAALARAVAPFIPPASLTREASSSGAGEAIIDETFRFRMMASVAFTYSALSDGELEDYVAVLESPPGRWLTRVTRAALVEAFQQPPAAPASPAALRPAVGLPR